ncbi:Membrane protein of ER body-like protein [Cucurbita argyrosperma subsp. argyrosperma]|nr:Membrane protein of ER body-like protein [Cucurbita argyrosperma subsp. argyrosperma]
MNRDKHLPEVETETTGEDDEEPSVLLRRKKFRRRAQSSFSSTDSDETFSEYSEGRKFVVRDEQQQEQCTGCSIGSSRLKVDGDRHAFFEVSPTDEIEAISTRKTGSLNGTGIKFQHDQIPSAVSNQPSKGEIEEQASYKRVELRSENGTQVADLYLGRIYEKPSSHNFYCPNCHACVTKVIIREREWVNNTVSKPIPSPVDRFRCTSCLSFLAPIGAWLFPKLATPDREEEVLPGQVTDKVEGDHAVSNSTPTHSSRNTTIADEGVNIKQGRGKVGVNIKQGRVVDRGVEAEPSRFNRWEIVKSIVYGGLSESITSLGIMTSAASANTAIGNIIVLALANLIRGLFILGHKLRGLKTEQFRTSHEPVDQYEVVLGNRENYVLHCTLAIISFILFGLVPTLVYVLTFTKSNNKDFKLAAAVGASFLCIILLAIGKASIQRPKNWDAYAKTVATYIVIAAWAGSFSYMAGDLLDKFIKKYNDWFERSRSAFRLNLPLPEMSLAEPAWGSL